MLKHSRDFNLTRESVLDSGLAPETPGFDLQRACGTSLDTAIVLGLKIATGQIDSAHRRRCRHRERCSDRLSVRVSQIAFAQRARPIVRRKTFAVDRLATEHFKPQLPGVSEPRTGMSMGQHCEKMAQTWQIPRAEQDQLAYESHRKAAAAWDEGFYEDLVVAFRGLKQDNNIGATPRSKSWRSSSRPSTANGTLTAGNSTPMTDGSSAVLLASEEWAKARGLPVLAYLTYGKYAAVDFVQKEGLLMAPAYAVPRMLADAKLKLQDFDIYEIHEAFEAQVLCTLKAWESPEFCRERLGLNEPLGQHRSQQDESERRQRGHRPPVRRHRRTHHRDARQATRPTRRRPRTDFDLHGRRHGRHRHSSSARPTSRCELKWKAVGRVDEDPCRPPSGPAARIS